MLSLLPRPVHKDEGRHVSGFKELGLAEDMKQEQKRMRYKAEFHLSHKRGGREHLWLGRSGLASVRWHLNLEGWVQFLCMEVSISKGEQKMRVERMKGALLLRLAMMGSSRAYWGGGKIPGLPVMWARERSPEIGGPGVGRDGESDTWNWQT